MPHILLIEDNPGDAHLIREMYRDVAVIGDEYVITHCKRVTDATQVLSEEHNVDLILSDMSLPDSQGLETLNTLTSIASELPIIFMTGSNNETFVSAAIKAGAQDYMVKGHIDAELLGRSTRYAIERKNAQLEYEAAIHQANSLTEKAAILKEQRNQLLKLNKAKDEFISLASHQLRTPATSVKQYLAMVLDGYAGPVPEDITVFLRTAYDSNERQLTIIDDLLKTAQLDSGRYVLHKSKQPIAPVIQMVIDEYKAVTTMRAQNIVFEPDTAVEAPIDAAEFALALANLIENASKYSPRESTITVSVHQTKHFVKVSVSDTGVGIAAADIPKVFGKFTRLNNKFSDTVNGSGLGLYFVKRIMKMHGGGVQLTSNENQGSTFTVSVPV